MADKGPSPTTKKSDFLRAFFDLMILGLLLVGAGFGGYWYGIHEKLAPIVSVAPGTFGAIEKDQLSAVQAAEAAGKTGTESDAKVEAKTVDKADAKSDSKSNSKPAVTALKYWLTSSGTDYIGYSITVSVNGDQVDNFFGPGKIVDVTSYLKKGDNTVSFEAKQLGKQYNRHAGESKSILSVKLVSGDKIKEDFKPGDVALSYSRNAAETEDFTDSMHFKVN
ncbi:MAG: hypothetical protein K8F91_04665 [Candidatus Obscuribacterales bacterium]|nr:hypothetical protein [Candidatus Obscuribacterales bacterium]